MISFGAPVETARVGVVLLHGRGATAASMQDLGEAIASPGTAFLAPQAPGFSWYPNRFTAPLQANEPALSAALATVGEAVDLFRQGGLAYDRIALLGFSQGACLALEFAARNARTFGAVVGLSGGLIGASDLPDGGKAFLYPGRLEGVPVFLGCSDVDAHIPVARVRASARVFESLGAAVECRIYPDMGHTINADEIRYLRDLFAGFREAGA